MSLSSILFSINRKPNVAEAIERPEEILQGTLMFVGGTVFVKGGVQIDAQLKNVTVQAMDNKPIVLTALGKMEDCYIKGEDVLICGDFTGEIQASGDVEVTNSARVAGVIRTSGHALISPLATDAGQITIAPHTPEVVQEVMPKANEAFGSSAFIQTRRDFDA